MTDPQPATKLEPVDTLISGATIVTMDVQRRIITDGALAMRGDTIVQVGKRVEVESRVQAADVVDGRRFVVTPGFIDSHIHITGDPLTRGYVPDDVEDGFADTLMRWVIPRFHAHTDADERLSAQLAAVEMLRAGTTCFLEAGTVRHLDAVMDGLTDIGIRGRVGLWVEGRNFSGEDQSATTDAAIAILQDEVARYPAHGSARLAAWPLLVGHTTNTDEVWQAAKALADANGLGVSAHMSPFQADPDWFLQHTGHRPIEHLNEIGVLGDNVALTHLAHIDEHEMALLATTHTNAILCPFAALKGGFGLSTVGRFPEMAAAGINIALGSDGYASDLMEKMGLAAALFKDARQDTKVFPAHEALCMGTLNGARTLQMTDEIGALEVGKKADIVLHDTDRPEWRPLLNPLHQLVWSVDGRAVHSVWVDGVRVLDNYHMTTIDETSLYADAQRAGEAIIERSGIPSVCAWPTI